MTPDEQRWLGRAKKLAAEIQRNFKAGVSERGDRGLVDPLILHVQTLLDTPAWHGETLDAFLKDMLPLADCCASLEAQMPNDSERSAGKGLRFAGLVSLVSRTLLAALDRRFSSGATPPAPALIQRLALSASVPVRWWPRALRAAAERELGQATQPAGMAARPVAPDLLLMADDATTGASAVLSFMHRDGPHAAELRATLCAPATLASTLGNLAAVYALFARSPASYRGQAKAWFDLTLFASIFLFNLEDAAVTAALKENEDAGKQLAAALLPYTAHLLETADLRSAAWFDAWRPLAAVLAAPALWPSPEAAAASQAAQRSVVVAEGLLRLLRALPPLGKQPRAYSSSLDWVRIPLHTATAAALAATSTLEIVNSLPPAQVQREAALRKAQQRALSTLLALLPITVDLLTVAAGQLAAPAAGASGGDEYRDAALVAYAGALRQLVDSFSSASELLEAEDSTAEEQTLGLQPEQLAAAAEAALRFAAQAGVLGQPLQRCAAVEREEIGQGLALVERILVHLPPAAKQEVSAAPEAGGMRPSLQAQLRFVHTACKFVRVALAPGAASVAGRGSGRWGMSVEQLQQLTGQLFETCSFLLFCQLYEDSMPQGRAPLTAAEKRAVNSAALALSAASSAVMGLLPEGSAHDSRRVASLLQSCRLISPPADKDLVGALLAQHAELAEQLVAGLVSAMKDDITYPPDMEASTRLDLCFTAVCMAVHANRRLGPMMLGGAAGQALEAAARQGLQASLQEGSQGTNLWAHFLKVLAAVAEGCFDGNGRLVAARLRALMGTQAGWAVFVQGGWGVLEAVRAAADAWLAQEAQQQCRQEQQLLCAEAAATRACSNLACTNLAGASEAGLKNKHCSGCRCVRYCSTACQRTDWGAGHKAVCKRLQAKNGSE